MSSNKKILCDQNLSPKLPGMLHNIFPNMKHVEDMQMDTASDYQIWDVAQREGWNILTKDGDFRSIQLLRGFPPKIIWLRCGNASTNSILSILTSHSQLIEEFLHQSQMGILQIK